MQTNPQKQIAGATPGNDPAPLGHHPSAEKVLDAAVQYTFPASDATAIGAAVHAAQEEAPPIANPAKPKGDTTSDFPWPRSAGK